MTSTANDLARLLAKARQAGQLAEFDAALLPDDPGPAHAAALGAIDTSRIAAWKIGGANAWSQQVFGNAELFYGALLTEETTGDTEHYALDRLVAPRAEPEIMLEIAQWPPAPDAPLFSRMSLGFEIPATVLPVAARSALCGQILDRAGAGGLWLGRAQPFDGAMLCDEMAVSFRLNDKNPQTGRGADVFGGPLGSALLFLGQALRRNAPLRAGQWIATGGLVPSCPIQPGDRIEARAGGLHARLEFA